MIIYTQARKELKLNFRKRIKADKTATREAKIMIKFKNGQLEVKFMDSTIVVLSKARNVFNLLDSESLDTLKAIEKNLKGCKDSFKFRMSFNNKKDILKIVLNDVIYSLNAILI